MSNIFSNLSATALIS